MPLRLNGKTLDLNPPPPTLAKLLEFLKKSSPDDLYTMAEIAKCAHVAEASIGKRGISTSPELAPYSLRHGVMRYFGSQKAIAELRKQVGL
jgi:hypothetical protein